MRNTSLVKHVRYGAIARAIVALIVGGLSISHAADSGTATTEEHKVLIAEHALSPKQQAIPLIAAFMANSNMPKLNAALNQGLDAGLTISETKEILVQLYAYTGFPRSLNALGELLKVVEERKQRGIQDPPGRDPSRLVPTGDALRAAGTANQTRISGAPVKGPVFDFAPVINQFLQDHLFGDIFERDNLDWQAASSPRPEPTHGLRRVVSPATRRWVSAASWSSARRDKSGFVSTTNVSRANCRHCSGDLGRRTRAHDG